MSSFASVYGPSMTVNSPSAYLILVASSNGPTPPVATSTPALVASATRSPIRANISGLGGGSGAVGSPRVYPRNRILLLLRVFVGVLARGSFTAAVDRHGGGDFFYLVSGANCAGAGPRSGPAP